MNGLTYAVKPPGHVKVQQMAKLSAACLHPTCLSVCPFEDFCMKGGCSRHPGSSFPDDGSVVCIASGGGKKRLSRGNTSFLSYQSAKEMTALFLSRPAASRSILTAFRRRGVKMGKCDAAVSKAHKKNGNQCTLKMEEVIQKSSTENLFLKGLMTSRTVSPACITVIM